MNTPKIMLVSIIQHYGRETIKPENDLARIAAELLGQKTLTRKNVENFKRLGFVVKTESVEL